MNRIKKLNKSEFIAFAQAISLFPLLIDYLISASCKIIGVSTDYLRIIAYIFYSLIFFPAILFSVKRKMRLFPLVFPIIMISSIILVSLNKPEILNDYADYYYALIIMCIPTYFLFTHEINTELLYKYIMKISYISAVFFSLIYLLNSFFIKIMNTENYQVTSYAFLLPIFFLLQKKEKNVFDYLLISISVLLSVFVGGRASILCIGIFTIIMLLKKGKESMKWTIVLFLVIIISTIFFDKFIMLVATTCEKFNIHGGIASYLSRGDVFDNDSRSYIYEECFKLISAHPFRGYGVLAERYLIKTSIYEHNIVLEFILQYGSILTGLFFVWFIIKLVKLLKYADDNNLKKIVISLVLSKGLLVLMFSASYLQFTEFFALIAILTHSINKKNKQKEV